MARYRQVETAFWTDSFVLKLTPEEKYYYLFLLTNPHTTQCGIYELPEMMAQVETGYNRETLIKLRDRFVNRYKKIAYSEQTEEYCIVNWLKYNSLKSPKVKSCIEKEIADVKDKSLIQYLYGIESLSIDWGEEEEREEEEREEEEREEKKKETIWGLIDDSNFTDAFKDQLREWVKYKNEKNDRYKPTGFKKLLTQIQNNINRYGEEAVMILIDESMANNWKGIIWSKLESNKKQTGGNPFKEALRKELENEQSGSNCDYDGYQGGLSKLLQEPGRD
jgi:hypothetical protein